MNQTSPEPSWLLAENMPIKMRTTDSNTGIRKVGATLLIIFTPPNTIKHNTTVTRTPYTCKSCKFGLLTGSAVVPDADGAKSSVTLAVTQKNSINKSIIEEKPWIARSQA